MYKCDLKLNSQKDTPFLIIIFRAGHIIIIIIIKGTLLVASHIKLDIELQTAPQQTRSQGGQAIEANCANKTVLREIESAEIR